MKCRVPQNTGNMWTVCIETCKSTSQERPAFPTVGRLTPFFHSDPINAAVWRLSSSQTACFGHHCVCGTDRPLRRNAKCLTQLTRVTSLEHAAPQLFAASFMRPKWPLLYVPCTHCIMERSLPHV